MFFILFLHLQTFYFGKRVRVVHIVVVVVVVVVVSKERTNEYTTTTTTNRTTTTATTISNTMYLISKISKEKNCLRI